MNMYLAWRKPYSRILLENIFYFTPGYRPMGTLVYRLLFDSAGINAFPYRLVCLGLIIANLYLVYRTAGAIAGVETGCLAALLACYNSGFADLYLNSGTIYDVLCFTFYFAAFLLYVNVRNKNGFLPPRGLAAFLLLYICALDSKEAAVTLPVAVLLYELIFHPDEAHSRARWLPAALGAALTVPFVIGKFSGSSPLIGNEGYRLHLGVRTYFRALYHYLGVFVGPAGVAFFTTPILVAARGKRSSLIFAVLFVLAAVLPVAFIPLRGGYAVYIATFGMALALAALIVEGRNVLARFVPGAGGPAAQAGTFLTCLLALVAFHNSWPMPGISLEDGLIRSMVSELDARRLQLNPKGRVLFLDDPFPLSYTPLFVLSLYYRAPDLAVDRVRMMAQKPDTAAIDSYDSILTFDGERLTRLKP
jgi:hypothetical protein